ncbi:MAG: hypothetical protein ABH858_03390, partial [Candidatus Omnitrophota bacterium]
SSFVADGLPPGEHKFTFKIGNVEKDIKVPVFGGCVGFFCKIEFVLVLGLSAFIFGLGIYFGKQDKPSYQIDIPDFPPSTTKT